MVAYSGPFTQLVKEILTVRNPNPEPVAFKVKTTAPKQYCVRPNSGRIEANQSVDVQDPPPDFKCKDKFLVQSMAISPELETLTLQELWSTTEKQAKETIKETKIRCVYLPPVEDNLPPASPPPNLPLPPQPSIPSRPSPSNSQKETINGLTTESLKDDKKEQLQSYKLHDDTNGHNMIGSFPDNTISAGDDDNPARLRRQLIEAQEEIQRLNHTIDNYKQELSTAQMRQRKSDEAASSKRNSSIGGFSVKTQEKIPEGYYPFEVVIAAAVGAFLFGVMFF
ncbi:19830_t:CDS:2 [Funneliformis geosporum]|uniref:16092_t:CDS:1 n=1 Tax=Funneliformis geosporum TaxID=1117311 RepID=A0A9W4SQ35_9GLOM|nr:19830_t:CDS:2 [Funneliformis geosporum]CAI2177510.1 16092_t:CDS:2 [Funneliformis geosporum]